MNMIASADEPGLTKVQNATQIVVLIVVSIITVWMLYMVLSWQAPGDSFSLPLLPGRLPLLAFG